MTRLPTPDAAALDHSARLRRLIEADIRAAGGWIPFARYMELALYAPGLGYYSAGARKLGAEGDFFTAPEITPLFGHTLARQAAQVLAATRGDIFELGAGTGKLALQLLLELERLEALPAAYSILEVSAELRERQQAWLRATAPHLLSRVRWLERLPERISGLVLANEVLDALPVHAVAWRDTGLFERGVAVENSAFAWSERPLAPGALRSAAEKLRLSGGYLSEIGLAGRGLVASLARALVRGAILFLDYGFGRAEYYHPQRAQGTLMCHYRQLAHDDPFSHVGLTDITAHVDFTAVAESALARGAQLLGYTTQGHFLVNCGITELLARVPPTDPTYLALAVGVQKLLSPSEMGELFKVMALGKGLAEPLLGFARGDRSRMLFTLE
ncbi:MAG TPA: SAM-dependent methyltransferase [Burkholderiales bacterium]|nr:SAM-dependent methyltransferase [Burkholderiales bacterium]